MLDAEDPAAVVFAVTGLDDDIETIKVDFGAGPVAVTLDGAGQFTVDLSGETGPVTATPAVTDEVPNTATASVTFTPGDTPAPAGFYDGSDFTNLDQGSTIIRLLSDPSTHEEPTSTNDGNGDGLNDGFDGDSYVDFGGGAGDKVSLDVIVDQAGLYDLTLRMANGNANQARPISLTLGDQVVSIANTQTGSFTDWQDFTVQMTLQAGTNTIVFAQTSAPGGPNIDSVTVTLDTPIGPPNDGTETVGGVEFTIYEAENAALDATVVVDTEDRNQSGDFVDYVGPGDETVTWTVSVPAAGNYRVDVLYALAASKGARPLGLTVNGQSVGTLPFVGQSNQGETDWFPEITSMALNAGVNTIALTAPGGVGPNLDYLRVSQDPIGDDLDLSADEGAPLTLTVNDQTDASAVVLEISGMDDDIQTAEISFNGAAPISVTPENGQVTLDSGVVFGAVEAVLTVTDDASNIASADADFAVTPDGNPNADIEVQSLDPAFFDNRLHFSFVQNSDGRASKDSATVQISNSGTEVLEIVGFEITGPFQLPEPTLDALIDGLTIDPGASIDIEVLFNADAINPKPGNGQNGVREGTLTLTTNDAEEPIVTVDLAGFWQSQQEGGQEPNVNEVWQVFGFGNEIANLPLLNGGESSVLDFDDLYLPAPGQEGIEILSPYWRIADGATQARATIIAAYNASANAALGLHNPGNKNSANDITLTAWGPSSQSQRLLPLEGNGNFATELFDNDDIPDSWLGDDVFGIEMAGLSTDPTLNPSGTGTPSQNALNNNYDGGPYTVTGNGGNAVVTDGDGNVVEDGYTVRMFQALDADGNAIENVFLGIMDYTGINYDHNDNMFIFEGITPVGSGGALAVSGLDAVAADDRLVFSNAGGNAGVRDSATITVSNDGIGPLVIDSVAVTGPFTVTGLSAGQSIPVGGSVQVTVAFTGTDPADDNAAVLFDGELVIASDGGTQSVALAGLAQIQPEGGEEPTVAQIVEAFGYTTDVAQGALGNGAIVETVGDEVLAPYFERLDTTSPVEVIQLAAYLGMGDVGRLNLHAPNSAALTPLYAQAGDWAQSVLPEGLGGSGSSATFTPEGPFGLKVTVDDAPTFAAWTDPVANTLDPAFGSLNTGGGHFIRFFEAKAADGSVIPGTYIGIQDYPGGGNFDYNDHMFLIRNVAPLGAANDADSNGINDALETDADNDGTPAFFDPDDTPVVGPAQAPFNPTQTPWAVDADGLTLLGNQYDDGGQGVAYNDAAGLQGGTDGGRSGSAVEIVPGSGAVGWIADGEWLEYTLDIPAAGEYTLVFNAALGTASGPARSITAAFDAGAGFYASASARVSPTGGWTTFEPTETLTLNLEAGQQVLRLTFNGGAQDLLDFTVTPVAPVDTQAPFGGTAPVIGDDAVTILANTFDEGGQGVSWNDNPGLDGGGQSQRGDTDVELVGGPQDIGFVEAGEWVEYTIDVAEAGDYALVLDAKKPIAGNSIAVSLGDGAPLATYALPDANGAADNGFGGTNFAATVPQTVALAAGEQTLRFTFEGAPASNGYLLDFRSFTLDGIETAPQPVQVAQGGTLTVAQPDAETWFTVTFDAPMVDPVVVMGPPSFAGAQPTTMRVRDITETGFEFQLDEWDYLDGGHIAEAVSWLAVERGMHDLGDGLVIEAGSATGTDALASVSFANDFDVAPAVFAQAASDNENSAVATRVSGVTADSFAFLLQEEEAADGVHAAERVDWIAVTPGDFEELVAGTTADTVTHQPFDIGFTATAVEGFFGQIATLDGGDASALRVTALDASGATVFIEEEQSDDSETNHTTEAVSWLVLEQDTLFV